MLPQASFISRKEGWVLPCISHSLAVSGLLEVGEEVCNRPNEETPIKVMPFPEKGAGVV